MQMDSANLPSQGDLNNLYGAWNPMSYMQGYENQDLASQFRQQAFAANANTVQKGDIENQLAGATIPYDIAQKQANVDSTVAKTGGQNISNQVAGLGLASDEANFNARMQSEHEQFLAKASDAQVAQAGAKTYQDYLTALKTGVDIPEAKERFLIATGPAGAAAERVVQSQIAGNRNTSEEKRTGMQVAGEVKVGAGHDTTTTNVQTGHDNAKAYVAEMGKGLDGLAAQLQRQRDAETDPARWKQLDASYKQAVQSSALTRNYGSALNLNGIAGIGRNADVNNPNANPGPTPPGAPPLSDEELINRWHQKK